MSGASTATVEQYITTATLLVPCGCLWVVVVEKVVHSCKGSGAAFVVHVLACLYGALMFVPALWVQLIAAMIYGFYRALLFSVIAVFNIGETTTAKFSATCLPCISFVRQKMKKLPLCRQRFLVWKMLDLSMGSCTF